ncbi:cell division protein FtsA [Candidatus Saccharibacteria bacterium]|nr:cell division protein FtsA [Candidatus Saccharibacteria bacterium]MCA9337673.1 cell division protein FtsA [Candidatus Saccharibacteria bacterium]
MREQQTQYFVGLDIGTSTVRCVVGTTDPDDPSKAAIVGHGAAANSGMRKGVVAHIDDVADAVSHALTEAERVSGFQIHAATVNINGAHVGGINSKGVIAISTANRQITDEDRIRSEEAATIVNLPANREILQVFAKNYRVDGQDNIKDPVGMHGVRLEVDTHIVTAATPNVKSLEMALEKARVAISHRTVSSLAAAEAVLSREQKEAGTLLLDIGAGTTNLVVIEDGEVQYVGVIPIGGIHLTNDLAIGLKTDLDIAEQVKIQHATLAAAKTGKVKIKLHKQEYSFENEDIAMIVEARLDELFELVEKELKHIHKSQRLPGGVVLVGGTAKIPGIADFAKEKLQLPARVGAWQPIGGLIDTVSDISYTTAVGLMLLDMYLLPQGTHHGAAGKANEKVFGALDTVWKRIRRRVSS